MPPMPAAPVPLVRLVDHVETELTSAGVAFGHGTDNARDEAAWLVLEALGRSPVEPVADITAPVDAVGVAAVGDLLRRRLESRRPLAYLTGRAWFAGLEFRVDERALIPRSPLAEPIAERFAPWLPDRPIGDILDIGTGSGCIAIACALAFPEAMVDASDVSDDALSLARDNVELHDLGRRVRLHRADVYAGLPPRRYDLIVSNPPYVDAPRMDELPAEYRHEPATGLAAGSDGLDIVARILAGARQRLVDDGLLVVEVGASAAALERHHPHIPFTWLELEAGGEGVFALTAADLRAATAP